MVLRSKRISVVMVWALLQICLFQSSRADENASETVPPSEQQQQPSFDLWELRVKGNTLLDNKQVEMTVYPFLGPGKDVNVVDQARAALENLYHNKGYKTVAVDIPEQDVVNGVVYLQVTEGKVSRLRVKGSRYFSLGKIKKAIPELAEGSVPNLPKMQQQLAELGRQSGDRKIIPIMRAGKTPGTLEVDLKVKDKLPLHGSVGINGRNSQNTTRTRLVTNISYDNLWQRFHSASFMFLTSPENNNEVEVFSGTYVLPVIDNSTRLAMYVVSSSSNTNAISQAGSGGANIIGTGDIYGLRLIKAFPSSPSFIHSATLGVDYKSFSTDLPGVKKYVNYLPFSARYNTQFRGSDYQAGLNLGVNFSLRGLINNDTAKFDSTHNDKGQRNGARPNYIYLTLDGNFNYRLPWEMALQGRFATQIADSPLISYEQFFMGGATSVRGYFESQALADDGVMGSLELHSPRLVPNDWSFVNKINGLVFFDAAKGWIKQALPGQESSVSLYSAGVGMRFKLWRYMVGKLDWAWPLKANGDIRSGESRLHFNVAFEF